MLPGNLRPRAIATRQPLTPEINWNHPIARGLNFAAVPMVGHKVAAGSTFYDCVTREVAAVTGNGAGEVAPHNAGKSRQHDGAWTVQGVNLSTVKREWSVSQTQRGGGMVNEGTLIALASTVTQVDGSIYVVGGNVEAVSVGDGVWLGIDSFFNVGRGNILIGNYNGVKKASSTELLGNPFDNRLHFFGASFTGNGTDGYFFAEGNAVAFTGGSALGTTQTNRRARIWHPGIDSTGRRDTRVALFLMWDRALTPLEYRELYSNPWQMFAAPRGRMWVDSGTSIPVLSAATVTNLTATTATPRVTLTF
jgi:hypothetical protein